MSQYNQWQAVENCHKYFTLLSKMARVVGILFLAAITEEE
jgi:hypothetical protein